jgi:hypothetical protein
MRKLIIVVALLLIGIGAVDVISTVSFTREAVLTRATVTSVELRPGPPKPTQNTPLHVSFVLPDNTSHAAIARLPLLQKIEQGDQIFLLVNPQDPQDVRLPLVSELWARPLAYLLSGTVLMVFLVLFKGPIRPKYAGAAKS